MGLFDDIRCSMLVDGQDISDREFQTKDTDEQYLGLYLIDKDGRLMHQEYDIEDRSDPNAVGLGRLCGMHSRVNTRWVPTVFSGAVVFYDETDEFEALFSDGAALWIRRKVEVADERSGEHRSGAGRGRVAGAGGRRDGVPVGDASARGC